ncbi:hypothetical protein DS745_02530 [Anaerobacillus alkaliphilus]|uniref:Uncharacterized protein n=1 Tax=Anaerobacillus alkaliphilus TaxID=1548597 RepID=A0A4Q0VXL6_9BACI|nr:hypothetical protein [Anaerobacillus alkaliphilus]RXJ04279.1 hypothetical protein DS745_02530 [Anaerobacillus alkaliphilus]
MLRRMFKHGEETIDQLQVDDNITYIVIHFTPRQDYLYVSEEQFEEDDAGNLHISDSIDDYYLISGNFVYLELEVKRNLAETLLEVKKRYQVTNPTLIEIS